MAEENYLAKMQREMMQSYFWVRTTDGSVQQVEKEIAVLFPIIRHEVVYKGLGTSNSHPIPLPQQVNQAMLSWILDYYRFHNVPGRSDKERKVYDKKFIGMDSKKLRELALAAHSLQLKRLVYLTGGILARTIDGKPELEIEEILNLLEDLTEEGQLEALKNTMDDPGSRLLNKLNAKKIKELEERERLQNVEVEEHVDERSVDDLVSFINGGDPKVVKTSKRKKKKKNKKKKDQTSDEKEGAEDLHDKESHDLHSKQQDVEETGTGMREVADEKVVDDIVTPEAGSDDDDHMDPAQMEIIDREVAEFDQRLTSLWVETRGQERQRVPFSMNGNGKC